MNPFEHPLAKCLVLLRRQQQLLRIEIGIRQHVHELGDQQEVIEQVWQQVAELHPAAVASLGRMIIEARHGRLCIAAGHHLVEPGELLELTADHGALLVRKQALQKAGLDQSAWMPAVLTQQSGENAGGGGLSGGVAGYLQGGKNRTGSIDDAGEEVHAAAVGGNQVLVPRQVGQWAAAAEAGDMADVEMRMSGVQLRKIEAAAFQGGCPPAGDEHIGTGRQGMETGHVLCLVQIELQRPLAALPHRRSGQLVERMSAGAFDPQHLGAEIRQVHGGEPCHGSVR